MGLFSSIFSGLFGGGGSQNVTTTTTSRTNVEVSVDPQIGVLVDFEPIERLVGEVAGQGAVSAEAFAGAIEAQADALVGFGESLKSSASKIALYAAGAIVVSALVRR